MCFLLPETGLGTIEHEESKEAVSLTPRQRLLIALLLMGGTFTLALLGSSADEARACEQWQERYEAAQPQNGEGSGVFDSVNLGPLAELRKERPEDCPIPD